MKKLHSKKVSKIITTMIIAIMLCNFIMPNFSYAKTDTEGGGQLFDPLSKFLCHICDRIFQFLQETFITMEQIETKPGQYNYQFSPAVIFSGRVPAFDINFITPNTEHSESADYSQFVYVHAEESKNEIYSRNTTYMIGTFFFPVLSMFWGQDPTYNSSTNDYGDSSNFIAAQRQPGVKRIEKNFNVTSKYWAYYWVDSSENLHIEYKFRSGWFGQECYYGQTFSKDEVNSQLSDDEKAKYESIANKLQNSIASWYKALRRISLVGLLSVLVYLGIRIVINTASGVDASKYKQMLTDWFVAMCLLFTLHYLMNIIVLVVNQISSLFSLGITDPLLNDLRTKIYNAANWNESLSNTIIYLVLTIYTVMFSFQYLKRVVYMAFFTMIAPLITLTYPLDKVKDGQAQAFNMWFREFTFNALIQVVHIILYFVLISSAEALVVKYPLIAIVSIGFMTQGEKIIRRMFGFENATTVGTLKTAAAGGLIMSGMKKLGSKPQQSQSKSDSKSKTKSKPKAKK